MLNIKEIMDKIQQGKESVSINHAMGAEAPANAKITIEVPGQEPVILDKVDEFFFQGRSGAKFICLSIARIPFVLRVFTDMRKMIESSMQGLKG